MIQFKNNPVKKMLLDEEMQQIYEKIKTPNKVGAVMKWDEFFTDSPSVFRKGDKFYMYFIAISKDCSVSGYETHLAESEDLLNWEYVGPIFKRNDLNRWDSKQCAGYVAFVDNQYDGTNELLPVNDNYYISYLAGNSDGYEPDPLFMGLARSSDPTNPDGFTRLLEPIMSPDDADRRLYEEKTLYKSFMFRDDEEITGYPYVNVYNAKGEDDKERIYLAVSNDGEHWERYGDRAILDLVTNDPTQKICGDPQIIKIDDVYVMFFFRYGYDESTYNTFACSRDLINWKVWEGKPLVEPECDWENEKAHKTWFVRFNGKNYHFYCACNCENERFIALATS